MDRRLVVVTRLFYEQELSKKEIGDRLGVSITHVSRLLKEAARQGVVKILIEPPALEGLEVDLKDTFKLRDARVILGGDEETLHRDIGLAAAKYFEGEIETTAEKPQTVGLGSGRTLFEMVSALTETNRYISIYPLSVWAERLPKVKSIDANTLVKILWFKSGPDSATANRLELFFPDEPVSQLRTRVRKIVRASTIRNLAFEIERLDNYFFSCSSVREDSQLSELQRISGNNKPNKRVIGDIVFNTIDKTGEYVSTTVEDLIFRVDIDTLSHAASDRRKRVVLAAGGRSKVDVIYAGIRSKRFNTLITDQDTAEHLLRMHV